MQQGLPKEIKKGGANKPAAKGGMNMDMLAELKAKQAAAAAKWLLPSISLIRWSTD